MSNNSRYNTVSMELIHDARSILKESFGYDHFRSGQEEIIQSILSKQDTLVLMPTGGGKSICFQVPALMLDGVTLVISPLISLMKDQVGALRANGIAAAFYNSSLSPEEENQIIYDAQSGMLKLLYISPERLKNVAQGWLSKVKLSLVAIDEAHCVSMWGHDFRPEYTQLADFRKQLAHIPFVALTATADKTTRRDIIQQLGLNDPKVFVSSFDRPNLSLTVRANVKKKDRVKQISEFIHSRPDESGIIYCLSRKGTEEMATDLQQQGLNVVAYHAGLSPEVRTRIQDSFINDKIPIICATIAFGMGIDKSNVRWVIHNNLPKNIESYYQEIGRSGRDGLPSDTVLYYSLGDIRILTQFAQQSGQADILMEKLKRMQQFAEATTCRRKILLSYFSEHLGEDCGNCDICKNPPKFIDGTLIAQMALSALVRTKEQVGAQMLIHILRGARVQDLLEQGYDRIKTYGAGREYSQNDWQHYITQLLNLGVVEIAYDDNFALRCTNFGRSILKGEQQLFLTSPSVAKAISFTARTASSSDPDELLFERLRKVRIKLAQQEDVPAYVIFNDATLRDMVAAKPLTERAMLEVQGVSKAKYYKYGVEFIMAIERFENRDISTYQQTHGYIKEGLTPKQIAVKRGIAEATVYSHLVKLYEDGEDIDLKAFINKDELAQLKQVVSSVKVDGKSLKPYFEALDGSLPYHKIRIGLALL